MLTVRGLSKTYPNGTRALDSINLTIESGEIVALIGGSGCGKSTLLRLLSGLEPPTRGSVEVGGEVISNPHPAVGIVFQEPRLLPWLTVGENIAFGLAGLPRAEQQTRVAASLERIGLPGYADRWPRELSGGQGQRVAMARALAPRPSVLLLDEPFSALDAFTRAGLQDHLLSLWEETRPTVVLVTHDIEEALVLASRIVVMRPQPGRISDSFGLSLARPRERTSPEFETGKRKLWRALRSTLDDRQAA